MALLYLTPASISYLNQFLLTLLITLYLGWRWFFLKNRRSSGKELWLLFFMGSTVILSLLLLLEVSFMPETRLLVVFAQNTVLAVVLLSLIQFAYCFPEPEPKQRMERLIAFSIGAVYTILEAIYAGWRYGLLAGGQVEYRIEMLDILPILLLVWVVIVFLRKALGNLGDRSLRRFAWLFLIPVGLAALNLLRTYNLITQTTFNICMSVGILFTLFLFTLNYLISQPGNTSLIAKAAGAILTGVLAFTGVLPWLLAPAYAARYTPSIKDHRTLEFIPNDSGGYDIQEGSFSFEENIGERWVNTDVEWARTPPEVEFSFPFYGQQASEVYVSSYGAVGIGKSIDAHNFQYNLTNSPAIFPLLVDLSPNDSPGGGIYVRHDPKTLTITYFHLKAYNHPDAEYTYQLTLHSDGRFEINYNGLPQIIYYPDDVPEASGWVVGAKPESVPTHLMNFSFLPLGTGPEGALQNEYEAFRSYMHAFLVPLALAIFIGSLFFLVGLPLAIHFGFGKPLSTLIRGLQAIDSGTTDVQVPVAFNDEVGYLTETFNRMSADLDQMIKTLEANVQERDNELVKSEQQYRDLFEMETDAIFIIRNSDGLIMEANRAASVLYGYSNEELLQIHNTDLSAEPKSTRKATQSPAPMEQIISIPLRWHRKKDGTVFPVEINARFFEWRGESVHIAAIRDITARVQLEDVRRQAELRYRALFEQTHDAVFVMDFDGNLMDTNQRAADLLGYTIEELRHLTIRDISAEVDKSQATFDQVIGGERVPIYERIFRCKDGSTVPVEIYLMLVKDTEGNPIHAQSVVRDISERKKVEAELERLAITDPLTGLYNRRYFFTEAEKLFSRSNQPPYELSVLMLDIDRFKAVNDTYGHQVGDEVLREATRRIQEAMRPTDLLARTGGEEFLVLLPRTDVNEAREVARRLVEVTHNPIGANDAEVTISLSIGIAGLQPGIQRLDELISRADQAMYAAKAIGGNRWVVWNNIQN